MNDREWLRDVDPGEALTGAKVVKAEWQPMHDLLTIELEDGRLIRASCDSVEVLGPR